MLQSILAPTLAWAVTGGPHQPEYTSYEEAGATDMVNLLTGDFTYNIPIVNVPSPEGVFSLPLSYHAGIGLDQPATWTGLGWNINPGAITRSLVEYPDDAHGESFQIERKNDDIAHGWTASIPIVGQIGWDSNVGHYGTISLLGLAGASYKNGSLTGSNTMGVHFSSKNVHADPVGIATAVMTVASLGTASVATSFATALAKEAATGIVVEGVATAVLGVPAPNFNAGGYWPVSQARQRMLFNTKYWVWLDQTRYEDMYGTLYLGDMPVKYLKNDKPGGVALQVTGPSYAGSSDKLDAPVYVEPRDANDEGAASDMHYAWDGAPYEETHQPSSLAPDYYNVMGAGISGAVQPYRLDVGTLSMPRAMTPNHVRVALAPFKKNSSAIDRYKVQFMYSGSPTNRSIHQAGATSYNNDGSLAYDAENPVFGINYKVDNPEPQNNRSLQYNTQEDLVLPRYFDPVIVGSTTPSESNREGLTNRTLSQGNQVQWYSNQEIINGHEDIINPLPDHERLSLPGNNIYQIPVSKVEKGTNVRFHVTKKNVKHFKVGDIVTIGDYRTCRTPYSDPPNYDNPSVNCPSRLNVKEVGDDFVVLNTNTWVTCGTENEFDNNVFLYIKDMPISNTTIGGFTITRTDGKKYHYALPVYEWDQLTYIQDANDNDNITRMRRTDPFASTWLLTAVTGPDYVDRGSPGLSPDDWGYWVNLNYERTSADYTWRTPYKGMRKSADDQSWTYSQGHRQQYYLKTIETRSHIATFKKSLRLDGKDTHGADYAGLPAYCGRPAVSRAEASSYQLDEITLEKNNEYLKSGEYFLGKEMLNRMKFHYDYDLCPGTPNSLAPNQGKLTLKRLSTYGSNNFKTTPDYVFEYGANPSYHPNAWDGWGMYNGSTIITDRGNAHQARQINNANDWSLTKVNTPLGSALEVQYERDDYASVAGMKIEKPSRAAFFNAEQNPGFWQCGNQEIFLDGSKFKVGDKVRIDYRLALSGEDCKVINVEESTFADVLEQASNKIRVSSDNEYEICQQIYSGCSNRSGGASGKVTIIEDNTINRKGGRSRVKTIAVRDENNNVYRTRYLYTQNGKPNGNSSGVVSREPEYIKTKDYLFYQYLDWPSTPVMYGQVTVLQGALTTDNDYDSKQVYEFVTPHHEMLRVNTTALLEQKHVASSFIEVFNPQTRTNDKKVYSPEYLTEYQHAVDVRTSGIGQLRSVTTYDGQNRTIAQTTTEYTDQLPDQQGLYTESTLLVERLEGEGSSSLHRAMRTTKRYYPSVPAKTTTTTNGFTTISENKEWDFITGAVLAQESQDAMGQRYRSETVPAYYIYPDMGPLPEHPDNVHMLSQIAARYVYKVNDKGQKTGLLGAGVQTWKQDWNNYRETNSSGQYRDSNAEQHHAWRTHENYVWRGEPAALQADGTYPLSKFNTDFWAKAMGWQYQGEITRYDHYAMPLESRDMSGNHAATRMGYHDRYKIAEAAPARYLEMAYAGFEEKNTYNGQRYAESEVHILSGNITSAQAHTGEQSLQLSGNQPALKYHIEASGYDKNRDYRLSVWVQQPEQAQLYYTVSGPNGTQTYTAQADPTLRAGKWYLVNSTIKQEHLVGSTTLEVGVRGATPQSQTYVDDFRFQPLNAGMNAYVYNAKGEKTYTLNNHNLYTRYQYDDAGRMIATYQEVLRPDGTLSEYKVGEQQYNYSGAFGY